VADVRQIAPAAGVVLKKNNTVIYTQRFNPDPSTYTEQAGQTLVIGTASSTTLSQGTISTVRNLILQSSKAVLIIFNGGSDEIDLTAGGLLFMAATSLSAVKVKNESGVDDAEVEYMLTD